MGGWGGLLETDNRAISAQLNLTGTATGTELGNISLQITILIIFENLPASRSPLHVISLLPWQRNNEISANPN